MTKCRQHLSSLAPQDPCPICGSAAIDHKAWRSSKAREAGISLDEWEGRHWTPEEEVDHVQETLDEIASESPDVVLVRAAKDGNVWIAVGASRGHEGVITQGEEGGDLAQLKKRFVEALGCFWDDVSRAERATIRMEPSLAEDVLIRPPKPFEGLMVRAITDPFEISLHELLENVQARAIGLRKKWGPFASLHEMESVIREEVGEFTAEVFREKKRRKRAKAELVDIITAAARAWAELDQGEPLSDLKASKKQRKALAE